MDLSAATGWWVAAGLAIAAELATGTFYLLMIAVGLVAAALAAHMGVALPWQLVAAAVVGGGATAAWHLKRRGTEPASDLAVHTNRNVNLDVGERVHVAAWSADRTAQVRYRGAGWTARLSPGSSAQAGEHVVAAVEGNWLVLAPAAAPLRT